jgi:RNA polymerase sigma-70 factor (ECF subfamily)
MTDDATLSLLLNRVAMQDRAALRGLYEAVSGRLMAVVYRMLNDRGASEDVLQDTFVTVWTRAPQFPALRTSPMAWLTSIARNRAIDLMRKRRPETPLQWHDEDGQEHHHDVRDESPTPLEQLLERQSERQLGDCIGRLDEEPRSALVLAYYEGLTHEQLATRLRRPLGTVKAWIRRSLLRLKECLGAPA